MKRGTKADLFTEIEYLQKRIHDLEVERDNRDREIKMDAYREWIHAIVNLSANNHSLVRGYLPDMVALAEDLDIPMPCHK